jgi:hypothetical protein
MCCSSLREGGGAEEACRRSRYRRDSTD